MAVILTCIFVKILSKLLLFIENRRFLSTCFLIIRKIKTRLKSKGKIVWLMKKVLWMIERVESGLWRNVLEISCWTMIHSRVEINSWNENNERSMMLETANITEKYPNQAWKIIWTLLVMLATLMCGFDINEKKSTRLYFRVWIPNKRNKVFQFRKQILMVDEELIVYKNVDRKILSDM